LVPLADDVEDRDADQAGRAIGTMIWKNVRVCDAPSTGRLSISFGSVLKNAARKNTVNGSE
jgi:hypothetical protein